MVWKEIVGEVRWPTYNIRGPDSDFSSIQTTLDPFRGIDIAEEVVDSLDYDVNTAIIYGTSVSGGITIFSDAAANMGVQPNSDDYDASDVDLLLLLEEGEDQKAAAREINRMNFDYTGSDSRTVDVNPSVHTKNEFIQDFRNSRQNTDNYEELLDEKVDIRWPYREFSIDYVPKIRSFATGFKVLDGYRDQEVVDEINAGIASILQDGEVAPALEEEFEKRKKDYSGRIETLERNFDIGKEYLERKAEGNIPRFYRMKSSGYVEDTLRPIENGFELAERKEMYLSAKSMPHTLSQKDLTDFEERPRKH